MYGAVDLLIVGQFAAPADISAVSTGSQMMMTITNIIAGFSMGTTILLGQQIGRGEQKKGGRTVGAITGHRAAPECGVRRTQADSDSAVCLLCGLGLATASPWAPRAHG